jgi:hypothetical protein
MARCRPLFYKSWSSNFAPNVPPTFWCLFQAYFMNDLRGTEYDTRDNFKFISMYFIFLEKELLFETSHGQNDAIVFSVQPRQLELRVSVVGVVPSIDMIVCTWLQRLSINSNTIHSLPASIALLTDLQRLELNHNYLTTIDEIDFVQMSNLTMLEVNHWFSSLKTSGMFTISLS